MSDVRKIIDLDRLSRFKDGMGQEIAGQTPAISGNKLTIGSSATPIAQDIVNVNDINGVPTTAYGSAAAARAAVDASSGLRIQGQIITYLLADGWYTDQYIGSATDSTSWGTASNWKTLGPVSVSQNTLTIGFQYAGEVSTTYDVTLHNSGATFASLSALLSDANLSTLIPTNVRKGGMSIKFVQTSDNKYVQYRLMSDEWSITESDWQGVDRELVPGSRNLAESGAVEKYIPITNKIFTNINSTGNYICFVRDIPSGTTLKFKVTGSIEFSRLWISTNNNLGSRLQDEVVKDTDYIITTDEDIENIGLYVYTLTTAGSLRLDMEIVKTKLENDIITLINDETARALAVEGDLIADVGNLEDGLRYLEQNVVIQSSWNKGKSISATGTLNTDDAGFAYIKIPVKFQDIIKITAKLGVPITKAIVAVTDETESYYKVVLKGDNGTSYEYVSQEDGYLCITVRYGNDEDFLASAIRQTRVVVAEYITENKKSIENITNPSENLFNANYPEGDEGNYRGYITGGGNYLANPAYLTTHYIKVEAGKTYSLSVNSLSQPIRGAYFYSGNTGISDLVSSDLTYNKSGVIQIPNGVSYIRLWIADNNSDLAKIMFAEGVVPAILKPFSQLNVKRAALKTKTIRDKSSLLGSFKDSDSLAEDEMLELPTNFVHNQHIISANIKGSITDVLVGKGYNVRYGNWVEITSEDNVIVVKIHFYYDGDIVKKTEALGFTIEDELNVSVLSDNWEGATLVIMSGSNVFTLSLTGNQWQAGGAAFVRNEGAGSINVSLSESFGTIASNIALFGDSYTYPKEDRTWTKWIYEWFGKIGYIGNQQPGINSSITITCFMNLISIIRPKFAIWGLGMNDGSDDTFDTDSAWMTASNNAWLKSIYTFIQNCEDCGIIPILVTIPTVPTINHERKNSWIRNSGYRYIDIADAVGATSEGVWNSGYLANDGIHATAAGGKAMALRVLLDFPEIICDN